MPITVYDISLQAIKQVTDYLEGTATDGSATYLKDVYSLVQANQYWDRGTLWIKSGTHASKVLKIRGHASSKLTFDTLVTVICAQQVETATVVGTIGAAGAGNATVIITATRMPNSPKTLSVAVANNDTATQVAAKIRLALAADTDVNNFFTIGAVVGPDVVLTTKIAVANDLTMNMSVDNGTCTGLTAAPTSANTAAGVAGPRYCVARGAYAWEQLLAAMQNALDETYVTGEDESLVGDGTTVEFTLPSGVYDIVDVELEWPGMGYQPPSTHWEERTGKLRFDFQYAPSQGQVIHIFYKKKHDPITAYSDVISQDIDHDWLAWTTARELLWWGAQEYGKKAEYMIEERLNKVLDALKKKQARRDGPNVMLHTSGG